MENPNTWTALHYKIDHALWRWDPSQSSNTKAFRIVELLNKEGFTVTINQIEEIIDEWNNDESAQYLSLPSTIINSLEEV